jgi:hypothetical protein
MARYLLILLFLTSFNDLILSAAIPRSDELIDDASGETLEAESVPEYKREPESNLSFDTLSQNAEETANTHRGVNCKNAKTHHSKVDADNLRALDAFSTDGRYIMIDAPNTITSRSLVQCTNLIRTITESCKKGMLNNIGRCKDRINKEIATCKDKVRRDIEECKHKLFFVDPHCDDKLQPGIAKCESIRIKVIQCEINVSHTFPCCERLQKQGQAMCATKTVPIQVVRQRLELAKQQCLK